MRCKPTMLVAAAIAGLTAAAPANYLILGSSSVTTAVAGGDGTDSRIIGSGGDYQGLLSDRLEGRFGHPVLLQGPHPPPQPGRGTVRRREPGRGLV
jgi:hypothetical protein